MIVAIDGPVASGKSTIAVLLAAKLGYLYFDTGVMYRAVTWEALQRSIPIMDEGAITHLSETLHIEVAQPAQDDGRPYTVYADGVDVTWDLRRPEVNQSVSPVSAYPGVRRALTAQQQRIGRQGRVVMVGRDIGTVVLPEADVKIYLEAAVDERARRRYRQIAERCGEGAGDAGAAGDETYQEVLDSMIRRDRIDSSREVAPLHPAPDAVIIDTTEMTIEQVLDRVLELVQTKT